MSFEPSLKAAARLTVVQALVLFCFGVAKNLRERNVRGTNLIAQAALNTVHETKLNGALGLVNLHSSDQFLNG